MPNITLGLDIGQYSIKGIRPRKKGGLRSMVGRGAIVSFEKLVPRNQASDPFTPLSPIHQTALKELVAQGDILPSDAIAVALPGHLIATREITLPFKNAQKIRQTVYYEVERQLPFTLEEAVLDYQILESTASTTRVLVFATPKSLLKDYLEKLASVGIDPIVVSVDQAALYHGAALNTLEKKAQGERNGVWVDIGATKTVLCAVLQGKLDWARTIPMGADFFVDVLQETYTLSWNDAERRIADLDQPEGISDCELLMKRLSPWATDIEVSLAKAESTLPLHLCGGVSAGVGKLVSGLFHREVITRPNRPDHSAGGLSPSFAQAAGLAFLPPQAINLRRGEFAHHAEQIQRGRFIPMGVMALLLVGLAGTNFYLQALQQEEKLKSLKAALRQEFTAAFPEVKQVVNEVKQAELAISNLRKQSDFFGIGIEPPLKILKQITDAIPDGVKIYITEFDVEQRQIQVAAQTTSFNAVDQIRSALMQGTTFENVIVGDTQVTEDAARISFRIRITLKTTQTLFQGQNQP